MHRWFRFSATIALVLLLQSAFAQDASEVSVPEHASASKRHQKPSLLQGLQDLIEQQGKQLELQTKQLEALNQKSDLEAKALEQQGKLVEEQSKRIETLSGEVSHLIAALKTREPERSAGFTVPEPPTPSAPAAIAPTPTVETGSPAAIPAAQAVTEAGAEANPGHLVKRGENLTSIARQHGTTVAELLRLNKIEDERKLQIGQTLIVPKPGTSAPASPKP